MCEEDKCEPMHKGMSHRMHHMRGRHEMMGRHGHHDMNGGMKKMILSWTASSRQGNGIQINPCMTSATVNQTPIKQWGMQPAEPVARRRFPRTAS